MVQTRSVPDQIIRPGRARTSAQRRPEVAVRGLVVGEDRSAARGRADDGVELERLERRVARSRATPRRRPAAGSSPRCGARRDRGREVVAPITDERRGRRSCAHLYGAVARERRYEVVVGQDRRREAFGLAGDRGAQDRAQRVVGHPLQNGARSNVPATIASTTSSIIDRIACWRATMSSGCVYSVALAEVLARMTVAGGDDRTETVVEMLHERERLAVAVFQAVDRVVQLRRDVLAGRRGPTPRAGT